MTLKELTAIRQRDASWHERRKRFYQRSASVGIESVHTLVGDRRALLNEIVTMHTSIQSAIDELDNIRWHEISGLLVKAGREELAEWTDKYLGYVRDDLDATFLTQP